MERGSDGGEEGSKKRREGCSITKQYQHNNQELKRIIKKKGDDKEKSC